MSVLEEIPAFSMWQIFYDTMTRLLKLECSESSIKQLANIVNSQELSRILVYSHDPLLSFEQYEEVSKKYKAFSVWLLGQFFYLQSCEKLAKIHKIAVNAQLRILYQISITQPHIYAELTDEYCVILKKLNEYDDKVVLKLNVFKPQQLDDLKKALDLGPTVIEISSDGACAVLKSKVLIFIEQIVRESLESYNLTERLYDAIGSLVLILKEDTLELKLQVLEIYEKILQKRIITVDKLPVKFKEKLKYMSGIFEQLIYDLYNLKIAKKGDDFNKVERILLSFFESESYENHDIKIRISKFLLNKVKAVKSSPNVKVCDELLLSCSNFLLSVSTEEISKYSLGIMDNLLLGNTTIKLRLLEVKIVDEVKLFMNENESITHGQISIEAISSTWSELYNVLKYMLLDMNCEQQSCRLNDTIKFVSAVLDMSLKVKLLVRNFIALELKRGILSLECEYFYETEFFLLLISFINQHVQDCKTQFPHKAFIKILSSVPLCSLSQNVDVIFHLIAYPFLSLFYKSNNDLPLIITGRCDKNESSRNMKLLYNSLDLQEESKETAFGKVCDFLHLLATGLVNRMDYIKRRNIDGMFSKILLDVLLKGSVNMQCMLARNVPHIISNFENADLIQKLLLHLTSSQHKSVLVEISNVLPQTVCIFYSQHVKIISWTKSYDEICLNVSYVCVKCNDFSNLEMQDVLKRLMACQDSTQTVGLSDIYKSNTDTIPEHQAFKILWKLFKVENDKVKVNFINTLPSLSKHTLAFHNVEVTTQWIEYAGDVEKKIRKSVVKVILCLLESSQANSELRNELKEETLNVCFTALYRLTKKSLQYSDYDLQDTLLETIEAVTNLKTKSITLRVVKMLLYFIMIPTSKYSAIAVNVLNELANKQGTKTRMLYTMYRKEICQCIVELCAINQALIKYDLTSSLEKVSLVLGFFGTKHFVTSQNFHLLPFLVALIVKMPKVSLLINEMAVLAEVDLGELLANNYGNIFLYIFLNEKDVFMKCMNYVEKATGLSGPVLRKRNLRPILNELLLNFYENKERVLLVLQLLAQEDTEGHVSNIRNIPDYLQPRFLGVLYHFDTKLTKLQVLLSLVEIFKFMGPKNIAPFRFKIIAMLKTALLNYSPELNCDVWNAFIRSCDAEVLGPQLATIFVSLLPLSDRNCESKMNEIFRYLLIDNEQYLKDYIPDLFFVLDFDVSNEILLVIQKYMTMFDESSFKEQLKWLMKYLMHETNDVKVYGIKFLKRIFQRHREELDRMILGYNGIDPIIVEVLDILTLGCRAKDHTLKLACGECIGELGAIEPSHLPRKYAQAQSFTFFITEDAFILSSLNELVRAFQAEKNTKCMDRFALAIQETLKHYGISPDVNSPKHLLWSSFPESQQELMLPLLSSRYKIGQSLEPTNVQPIYGSPDGSNFRLWVYNWTWTLIVTIKPNKRNLLEVYLPSLKDDHRILMHFLPHIVLHSLLEGTLNNQEKVYLECMAVINSSNRKKSANRELLYLRTLRTPHFTVKSQHTVFEDVQHSQCTKVVFVLLDFLDRWIREWEWQRGAAGREHEDYKKIQSFLLRFCSLQLAKCNFQCEEYPRALMYLEDYVTKNPKELEKHLSFLAEVYAQLDEPDAVAGVTALQNTEPTLEQKILALEVSGKLSDASACYERIAPPLKFHHLQGLIQCYLDLDNVNTAFNFAEGAMKKQPEYESMLLEMQAEPLWRLGKYEDLDSLLKRPELQKSGGWGVQVGSSLLHLRNGRRDEFQEVLRSLRGQQVNSLSATSFEEGIYQHGYGFIAKLHALNELEQIERTICDLLSKPNDHNACEAVMRKLALEWELRIKVVQESFRIIEPILCLRRIALENAKHIMRERVPHAIPLIDSMLGEAWLLSVKVARHTGIHQQAYTYTLKAEEYIPPCLFLEKAKLHWMREDHEQALTILRRGLEKLLPENRENSPSEFLTAEQKKICAEAKLLIATYNDNISNVDTDVNIKYYREAVEVFREWEKSLVSLAQYFDRVFQTFSDEEKDAKGSDMQIHMINYFGKSLQYGTTYVYQSMPRLLSIWFDYGTRLLEVAAPVVKEEKKKHLLKMTKLIDTFLERLPAYIFLTAFSQIISRICHPQKEVYIELKSIITKLILQYPQQSMWMMISVIKSSYPLRLRRCAEILGDSRLKNPSMTRLVSDFTKLAEKLMELCNKDISEGVSTASVSTLLRSLPRMLGKGDFSEIMIPTQKFRKLVLPNPEFKSSQHNPFPNHYVHIVGIEDEVTILPSLQRPRKITFRGSDGKGYIQMLKPKDDLRKDFRLMEFNDIVNQLLSRAADSRQRRLNIRLYSVAPLNEECGLIEWVPNLIGLRPVLHNLYKQRGLGMRGKELKEASGNLRDSLAKKRAVYVDKLLARHPPILGDWFRKNFPDAQGWLTARTAYTRTTAVISMVGYILGLGDRHGENILLDSTNGDTIHVDFNCLFNKGETFEWPERVPFRLTQNMVSAMGPLGVEGVFRKSCACTLRVLRTHINTLMSIVTPFVYDPLVSWPRNIAAGSSALNSERTNEQAVEYIRNIELRLQGMVRTRGRSISIPLSVEGQTNNIILEAMSIDNLCQMYIGWGAYL